jgi:hypothetical protein
VGVRPVFILAFAAIGCQALLSLEPSPSPTSGLDAAVDAGSQGESSPGDAQQATYFDFLDAQNWQSFAIETVTGSTGSSFISGGSTARYVVYVPYQYSPEGAYAGVFLSYDREGSFVDPRSWRWVDSSGHRLATATDDVYAYMSPGANQSLARWNSVHPEQPPEVFGTDAAWMTAASADGFVYFFPTLNPSGATTAAIVHRYDRGRAFTEPFSWAKLDLQSLGAQAMLRSTAFFANGAVYAFPYSGCAVFRHEPKGAMDQGWTTIASPYCAAGTGFAHAAFDGRFAYLPLSEGSLSDGGAINGPLIVRFDTNAPSAPESWTAVSLNRFGGGGSGQAVGAVFDGRYVFVASNAGATYRYDATLPFESSDSWLAQTLATVVPGLPSYEMSGFTFDGEYVYYLPSGYNMRTLRFRARTPRGSR